MSDEKPAYSSWAEWNMAAMHCCLEHDFGCRCSGDPPPFDIAEPEGGLVAGDEISDLPPVIAESKQHVLGVAKPLASWAEISAAFSDGLEVGMSDHQEAPELTPEDQEKLKELNRKVWESKTVIWCKPVDPTSVPPIKWEKP
jgi:hypothetical protein